jgi:hypothetical protein
VGGNGLLIYYPAAKDALRAVLPWFGIKPTDDVVETIATISTLGASAVTALATQASARKFYNATSKGISFLTSWCKKPRGEALLSTASPAALPYSKKRIAVACTSAIFATCNATMQYEVARGFLDLANLQPRIELAVAVVSAFSMTFWAMDEALLERLNQSDPRTSLLVKIDKVEQKLPRMNEDSLQSFVRLLRNNGNIAQEA